MDAIILKEPRYSTITKPLSSEKHGSYQHKNSADAISSITATPHSRENHKEAIKAKHMGRRQVLHFVWRAEYMPAARLA